MQPARRLPLLSRSPDAGMPRPQPADQRMIDHQCVLWDRCHGAIRGIGPLGGAGAAELVTAGAVGDLLGTFLDHDGRPVDHPFNTCSVDLPVADLATLPAAVLASAVRRRCRWSVPRSWAATSTT